MPVPGSSFFHQLVRCEKSVRLLQQRDECVTHVMSFVELVTHRYRLFTKVSKCV